jgi:hypothetical protein
MRAPFLTEDEVDLEDFCNRPRGRQDRGAEAMSRPTTSRSVLLATFGATLLAGGCEQQPPAATQAATQAAAASPYQPTATFQEVMDAVVDPAADNLWHAFSITVDAQGTHDFAPHTDGEWHQLRQRAIVLVEAANLIAVPGRRVAHGTTTIEDGAALDVATIQKRLDTKHDQLLGFAGAFRNISLKLLADIDRKDTAAIEEHGATLDEVCEACHKVFWYPEDQIPPAYTKK